MTKDGRKALLLIIVLVLAIEGLAFSVVAQSKKLAVAVGQWNLENEFGWKETLDLFQEQNSDTTIETIESPGDVNGAKEKLFVLAAGGVNIDVAHLFCSTVGEMIASGILQPLDSYIARDDSLEKDNFLPSMLNIFQDEGKVYGLPFNLGVQVMVYNKSYFDRIGLSYPAEDWTWQDLARMATRAMKTDQDGNITMGGFEHIWTGYWHHQVVSEVLWAHGGDYFNEECTELMFHTPAAREALEFLITNIQHTRAFTGWGFWSGDMAIARTGSSFVYTLASNADFELGMQGYPRGPAGSFNYGASHAYGLMAKARNPELAWELIKFASGEGYLQTFVAQGNGMPVQRSQLNSGVWLDKERKSWESIDAWVHAIKTMRSFNYGPNAAEAIDVVAEEWAKVVNGEVGLGTFVESVKPKVDAILAKK